MPLSPLLTLFLPPESQHHLSTFFARTAQIHKTEGSPESPLPPLQAVDLLLSFPIIILASCSHPHLELEPSSPLVHLIYVFLDSAGEGPRRGGPLLRVTI